MHATPRSLSTPLSFWVSAGIVAHTLWTSAAPAMVYPLYAHEWNLTPTVTTAIFAVYPIVVVAMLVLFGDLSDFIGRRTTMLLGSDRPSSAYSSSRSRPMWRRSSSAASSWGSGSDFRLDLLLRLSRNSRALVE